MATLLAGAAIAFGIAIVTTPAGVSGAVLLAPIQVGLLGVANPAVTPTNLLYNVVATPGGLLRYARAGRLSGPLARSLVLGTLPGVVIGAVVRVELLPGPQAFLVIVAAVLGPIGLWLLLAPAGPIRRTRSAAPPRGLWAMASVVGAIGGLYGIGGGSILAPLLLALGYSLSDVAGPALAATFVTSVAGVATYALLALGHQGEAVAPDWALGIALGVGGLAGSYVGARAQPYVPERALRRVLGAIALAVAARSLIVGLGG